MGGEGSGRKPDPIKQLVEQKTSFVNVGKESMFIPDFSGAPGSRVIQETFAKITDIPTNYLKDNEVDVGVGLTLTGDNSSADTAYVPMVLYNTDATPPTASGFPIGTIYIQYIA